MKANQQQVLSATLMLCISAASASTLASPYRDYARVIHVEPIYESVQYQKPYQECYFKERPIRYREHRATTPKVLGALIGGAIGHELGHNKSNKRVGAVAGAVLGGAIASDLQHKPRRSYYATEKRCHTNHNVYYQKELTGYNVEYRYHGKIYSTIMDQHPGKRVPVSVDVSPIGY